MRLFIIIVILAVIGCREKTSVHCFELTYENGDRDTMQIEVAGNPNECLLKAGCLQYWRPVDGFAYYADKQNLACYVRSFKILKN